LKLLATGDEVRLLNPDIVRSVHHDGSEVSADRLEIAATPGEAPASEIRVSSVGTGVDVEFEVKPWARGATLALLYEPASRMEKDGHPQIRTWLDGATADGTVEEQKGSWAWHLIEVAPGSHSARMELEAVESGSVIGGTISVWLLVSHRPAGQTIRFETNVELDAVKPVPPRPLPAGTLRSIQKLGEIRLPSQKKSPGPEGPGRRVTD